MAEKWQYWESDSGYHFRPAKEYTQEELIDELGNNPKLLWEIEADTQEEVFEQHLKRHEDYHKKKAIKRHEWFRDGGLPAIVTYRPPLCRECLVNHGLKDQDPNDIFHVSVTTIKSVDDGWVTEGRGLLSYAKNNEYAPVMCFSCGQAISALVNILPIECENFACPKCGSTEEMDFKVSKIERKDAGFDFEASLICKACKRKNIFSKFIAKLFDLIKIEIGPTGITLKKG
ncbi:MAG: hypothetical protein R3F37_00490 [Candidatus Competibacteraceae bacterium]